MAKAAPGAPPLVSVVIPTHNYARFIEAALRSVERQTYKSVEVIVVDDGSSDGVAELVHGLTFDRPLRFLSQPQRGISAARNNGIRASLGRYVAFLDADDHWSIEDQLERQVAFLEQHAEIGWVSADARPFSDEHGTGAPYLREHGLYGSQAQGPFEIELSPRLFCTPGFFLPTGTLVLRRACLEEAGGFDESLRMFEDTDLWMRIGHRYRIAFFPEVFLERRIHGGNSGERRFLDVEALERLFAKHALARVGLSLESHIADAHLEAMRYHFERGETGLARNAILRSLKARFALRRTVYLVPAFLGSGVFVAARRMRKARSR